MAGQAGIRRLAQKNTEKTEMAITASMVAELRAKTDAPMMECKKALTEAEGNFEKAEEILRVKLGNKAGKAASRVTAEGVIAYHAEGGVGALVEINCETDFVTKNDSFLAFTDAVAKGIVKNNPADVAAIGAMPLSLDGFGPTQGAHWQDRREHECASLPAFCCGQTGVLSARHAHRRGG
jgi:hypothetical protein